MAAGDLYSGRFCFNCGNHPAAFTLHWREVNTGATDSDDGCAALSTLIMAEVATINFLLPADSSFERLMVRKITGTGCPPDVTLITAGTGQQAGEALPLTKALVVRLIQYDTMASHNGRVFWPCVCESQSDGNLMTNTTQITNMNTQFNNLIELTGQIGGVDWIFGMVVKESIPASQGPASWLVDHVETQNIIYSQRRRKTSEWGLSP